MSSRDLLIELGTEELPPKALKKLSDAFTSGVKAGLEKAELGFTKLHSYAAPRRLAILITGVAEGTPDKSVEKRGPALTAAFDDNGNPTKAAIGFAKSCGLDSVEQLDKLETAKGAWLMHQETQLGQPASALIPEIVQSSLDKLPIPKRMRWGALDAEFVRPVHWLVLLFGDEVIEAEILTVKSGRETRGHRFHHPESIRIGTPADYAELLHTEGHVIADFAARRKAVHGLIEEAAAKTGGKAEIDPALLDEVTSMVEWPVAVLGNFEERFLQVPQEALISSMKGHQKYFHVMDMNRKLMPHFITISNIDSTDIDKVREGNERVIRPRLSDAEFFWKQDLKNKLADRIESLKTVVFQKQLGSMYDKTERVSILAGDIAEQLGGNMLQAQRAGLLSRCDLLSEMVYEFPELQGIMGRYYAIHDQEPGDIPAALDEMYMPRFAGDELPATVTGQALALAERIDTLVGIFGIGQLPTGSKDPFALRRAALGVVRILIERGLDLDLKQLCENATAALSERLTETDTGQQVFNFIMERLRAYYQDLGITHDTFDSVAELKPTQPLDCHQRIEAVTEFRKLTEADSLAAANKRISNILKKVDGAIPDHIDSALLQEPQEQILAHKVSEMSETLAPLFAQRQYTEALKSLAALREPVDDFFDHVMVMADDEALKNNRLALLNQLRNLFLQVADLSHLQ
ncbi:MAG: glycine--tRNA ligase subunit beta [Gammaproteobacteria bacterium]|nr:glycine--tRNA ligase subunit beta [Gammaproteobacteria bacterium]